MLKDKVRELNTKEKLVKYRDQDIALLLKLIVLDGETDLKKITSKTFIKQRQVEKYLKSKEIMMEYLNESEYKEYLVYLNKLTNYLEPKQTLKLNKSELIEFKMQELLIIKQVISDIMDTRLSKSEILRRNCINREKFSKIINTTGLLDSIYGEGFIEILKNEIKQNGVIRESIPRNMYIVEEREDISIIKENIIYLNELNFKRMKLISYYLYSGYNLDAVVKKTNLVPIAIIKQLLYSKNEEFLKPEIYALIVKLANLEQLAIAGDLSERKRIVSEIVISLEKNNYDINTVSNELMMPVNILKRFLMQPFITLMYSKEQIEKINNIFSSENENSKKK